jgi:transcriptional regulator with XRE-family HTH domain
MNDVEKNADPYAGEPLWRHVLGDLLRSLRHERGETLTDVATRAGVSPQYLSEVERGRKEPSSEMIAAISGALDLTLIDLTTSVVERLASSPHARASRAGSGTTLALAA